MENRSKLGRQVFRSVIVILLLTMLIGSVSVNAQQIDLPGFRISFDDINDTDPESVSNAMQVLALLTVLSLAPALLILFTSFTRIVIVLSMLRHAIGLQSTPPNTVIIGLSLFLTLFTMMPVIEEININAIEPYLSAQTTFTEMGQSLKVPIKEFMVSQTREQDLVLMIDIAGQDIPENIDAVSYSTLIPAFLLSELQTAFQIGFVIFLPFLLIDILVASILMSMGMIMLPPLSISLPIKILMFVLIDGWSLLTQALVGSFA